MNVDEGAPRRHFEPEFLSVVFHVSRWLRIMDAYSTMPSRKLYAEILPEAEEVFLF